MPEKYYITPNGKRLSESQLVSQYGKSKADEFISKGLAKLDTSTSEVFATPNGNLLSKEELYSQYGEAKADEFISKGLAVKKKDGSSSTTEDVNTTSKTSYPIKSPSIADIGNPVKAFGNPVINVSGVNVQIKEVPIPFTSTKEEYAKGLQQRVNQKVITNDDVSAISKSINVPAEAVSALVNNKKNNFEVIVFNDAKSKLGDALKESVLKANSDLGRQDNFDNVFATIESTSAYLSEIDKFYEEKSKAEFEKTSKGDLELPTKFSASPFETQAVQSNYQNAFDEIKAKNAAVSNKIKGILAYSIKERLATDTSIPVDERIDKIVKLVYPKQINDAEKQKTGRLIKEAVYPVLSYIDRSLFDDTEKQAGILNSEKAHVTLGVMKQIKEQIAYNDALAGSLIEDVNEKINSNTITEDEIEKNKLDVNKIYSDNEVLKRGYLTNEEVVNKYPVLFKEKVVELLNDYNAKTSGNVAGLEKQDVTLDQYLVNNGVNPKDQKVLDAIEEAREDNLLKDYSFWGKPITSAVNIFKDAGKGVLDIVGVRDELDRLSEKKSSELFPTKVGKDDEYQLTGAAKFIQNTSDVTGQVIGQGLLQAGTMGFGRIAGISKVASASTAFWTSGTLSSYDNFLKESYDLPISTDAGRVAYAGINAIFQGATEKIFPDIKIFQIPGFKDAVANLAGKVGTKELTEKLAIEALDGLKNKVVSFGKNYAENVTKESVEEGVSAAFTGATKLLVGDPNTDITTIVSDVKNTMVQTALGMGLIATMGARADMMREKNMSAKSTIYNAAIYHDEAMDAIEIGFNNKLYDEQEKNSKIQTLNTARNAVDVMRKTEELYGVNLTRPQKELYVANLTAESLLNEQIKEVKDPVLIKKVGSKISSLREQRDGILEGQVRIDNNGNFITSPIISADENKTNDGKQPEGKADRNNPQSAGEQGSARQQDGANVKAQVLTTVSDAANKNAASANLTTDDLVPTIVVNGTEYYGKNHGEAMDNAISAGESIPDKDTPEGKVWRSENGMFKEKGGDLLTRNESGEKYGIRNSEELADNRVAEPTVKEETSTVSDVVDFNLNDIRDPRGKIGEQGFTEEGARDLLTYLGIDVKGMGLKEMVEHLKSNPNDLQKLLDFTKKNPIELQKLPDGSYDLKDGNHRANLLYYAGIETVPSKITDVSNSKAETTPYDGTLTGKSPQPQPNKAETPTTNTGVEEGSVGVGGDVESKKQKAFDKFDEPNIQKEVKQTSDILRKVLPTKIGNYIFEKLFSVGGNWHITYRTETERTNIHTGEKYTDVSEQSFPLDKEDILNLSETELLAKIEERANKNGIQGKAVEQSPTKSEPTVKEETSTVSAQENEVPIAEIGDAEYNDFIDKGKVLDLRLNDIARKVKNQEPLSEREKEIFTDKTSEINKIIATQPTNEAKAIEVQQPTEVESTTIKEPNKVGEGTEETQKTEAGEPPIVPPVTPVTERGNEGELKDKGILASMYKSVPESAKGKVEAAGLKYRVQSQAEAKAIATQIVEDNGIDVALQYASNAKLDGDVRSMIYNVALNKLAQMEVAETDVAKKAEIANKYSDALIEYDEMGRDAGRFNSAIFDFYKSPLGMEFYTNKKREKAFKEKQAEHGKSWDDFYEQYKDEPEFAAMVQAEILKEKMKKPGFAKKAADSLRKKADDILKNGITPDWLKVDVKDAKTKGIDRKIVDKAIAKALKIIADAIEVGGNIASVVAEQVKKIKDLGVSAKDSEIAKWLYKESGATGMDAKTFEDKVKRKIESLEKTIKALEEKVKNNDTSIKENEVVSNDDIVALEAKVKELRGELETLRKEAKVGKYSDESKVAAAEKAAQKNIGELEEKIANNDLEFDKIEKPTSPQLEAYREKQKALRKELEEKRKEAKVGKYSDESRIRAIEDSIKEYERKISEKEYVPNPKEKYTGKLKDAKEQLIEAKKAYYEARKDFPAYKQKVSEKYLQRMKKRLDGLNERQRRKVVEESFKKLAENGALSQEEFREIIGNTLGLGKLTPEQANKLRGYVEDINAVDNARMEYVETNGSETSKKKLAEAEKKSLQSKNELGNIVYTESNVWDTIRAAMQLTAIGVPTIMKNFAWNFVAQGVIKFPSNAVVSLGDAAISKAANILNLPYSRTTSFMGNEQGAFFRHLWEGVKEGSRAVRYGINSKDYFEKGVSTKPIQPIKSGVEFLDWAKGNSDLTFAQGMDKLIKASWVGYYMEGVSRGLTFFDKPLRYAAEGGTASRIAKKELGLSDAQAKVFERVPKEFAIKHYMSKGDNLAQATKKAEVIVDRIKEVGDKSVAQQANILSETINSIGQYAKRKTEDSPTGKTLVGAGKVVGAPMALFIKTPANIAWQVFSLINPSVAVAQAGIFSANAYKKYKKGDVTYTRDLDRAKDWMGTAVVGIGMGMLGQFLTGIGVVESGEDEETEKKERDGTKQYSKKFTFNYSKFNRYIQGIPDSENDEDIRIDLSWFGQVGAMMDLKQRMAELSKDNPDLSYTDKLTEELSQSAKIAISSSVLNSASALSTAFSSYDGFIGFSVNYLNTMANIVQPQAFAQDSRAGIDYEYQVKADTFLKQLDNTFTARSSLYRAITDKYPPSDIGIWGDKIDKGGSKYLRYFGISKGKKNPFAKEIYDDAERTGDLDFLPPSVKNKITIKGEAVKLNTEQQRYLEEQVGTERKKLVTALIDGSILGHEYRKEKDDDVKKKELEKIYKQGFNVGKYNLFQKYPQLNPKEEDESIF